MKIKKADLINILSSVKPGLARQEVIEQSTSFVFSEGFVFTYNDEISVSHPVDLDIEGAVRAKELFALLSKIKDEEIDVTAEGGELLIKGAKLESGITMDHEVHLPGVAPPDDADWEEVPKGFNDAVRICAFSCASENVSAVLNSIHISGGIAESCDNYRLTQFELEGDLGDEVLIPSGYARQLIQYDFDSYCIDDGWLHCEKEETGLCFSCRIFEEAFPDLDALLDIEGDDVELPTELKSVLDRSGIFSNDADLGIELVKIEIKNKWLKVEAQNENGWTREKVRIKSDVDIQFSVNPGMLKEVLAITSTATLSENHIKFTAPSFVHVISLVV